MTQRQQAYADILKWGLLAIRESAEAGNVALCEIEAEHIHNLPSLFDEPNELRHRFYIERERSYYLGRLRQLDDSEYFSRFTWRYEEAWAVLSAACGA